MSGRFLSRWIKAIALVLILIGIGFRCTNLDIKPFWEDEVYTITRTVGYQRATIEKQLNQTLISVASLDRYRDPGSGQSILETARALASASEHTPLYFLLLRPWTQIVGHSVAAVRSLSVVFSVIGLGVCYLLGRSLFPDDAATGDSAGWGAATVVALSPMILRYSQEARPYSLWFIFIGLSIWALLRAWRSPSQKNWGIYGLTLVLAFYTQLLTVFVIFAQGCALVIHGFTSSATGSATSGDVEDNIESGIGRNTGGSFKNIIKDLWLQGTLKSWGLTTLISAIAMSPWLALALLRRTSIGYQTNWLKDPLEFPVLFRRWGTGFSYAWLDFTKETRGLWFIVAAVLMVGVAIATLYLWRQTQSRNTPNQQRDGITLLLCTTVIPALIIVLMDVLLGGRRSTVSRYVIPAYMGLTIITGAALGIALAGKTGEARSPLKKLGLGAGATVLFVISCFSCVQLNQAETWWGLSKGVNLFAEAIRDNPQAIVVSDRRIGQTLELAYSLPDNREIWWTKNAQELPPTLPDSLEDKAIALFSPSDALKSAIAQQRNIPEESAYSGSNLDLWILPAP
ncbi:MAG: glycosyltransferase family 39 protein [Cyanobacteria bacterium P01_D01_bin.73]